MFKTSFAFGLRGNVLSEDESAWPGKNSDRERIPAALTGRFFLDGSLGFLGGSAGLCACVAYVCVVYVRVWVRRDVCTCECACVCVHVCFKCMYGS